MQLQESVYEALVKQYEISKVEEAKQTPRLRVIDAGKEPERRSSPRIFVLFVLCTVCRPGGGSAGGTEFGGVARLASRQRLEAAGDAGGRRSAAASGERGTRRGNPGSGR